MIITFAEALMLFIDMDGGVAPEPLANFVANAEGRALVSEMGWRLFGEYILELEKWPHGGPRGPLWISPIDLWAARRVKRERRLWLKQHAGRERVPTFETKRMIDEAIEAAKRRFGAAFRVDVRTAGQIRNILKSGRL
jgi:hypothetical protein